MPLTPALWEQMRLDQEKVYEQMRRDGIDPTQWSSFKNMFRNEVSHPKIAPKPFFGNAIWIYQAEKKPLPRVLIDAEIKWRQQMEVSLKGPTLRQPTLLKAKM